MEVLIPPIVECALMLDDAIKQGSWAGVRFIGRKRGSLAYEFPSEQAKELLDECEYRTAPSVGGEGWGDVDPGERAAFVRLRNRLREQIHGIAPSPKKKRGCACGSASGRKVMRAAKGGGWIRGWLCDACKKFTQENR